MIFLEPGTVKAFFKNPQIFNFLTVLKLIAHDMQILCENKPNQSLKLGYLSKITFFLHVLFKNLAKTNSWL